MRARARAARASVGNTAELAEILQLDGRKAARFYARFAIIEQMFQCGVPVASEDLGNYVNSLLAETISQFHIYPERDAVSGCV
jgi:hypothetical protein